MIYHTYVHVYPFYFTKSIRLTAISRLQVYTFMREKISPNGSEETITIIGAWLFQSDYH